MAKRYKIGFLTSIDPTNKLSLSGSPYYMLQALKKYVGDVDVLGPVVLGNPWLGYVTKAGKKLPKPYNTNHSFLYARLYARRFKKKLKGKKYDFIFAPRCSTEMSLLKTDIPILYYSDTTFKTMYNYYSWFSNFCKLSEFEGNRIEKLAIDNSSIAVFSSEWAANSAINDYGAPSEKVSIVPFGPNVDEMPTLEDLNFSKTRDLVKLLFIGVEWERKGGQIAYDTLIELKKMGVKAKLTILGVIPPDGIEDDDMEVIPFLNKSIKEESDRFNQLFLDNHFFILPTREECFGVVFCEASAYGLPSLTSDTGGIPTAVIDGVNGFRFKLNVGGKAYAEKIKEYFSDYDNKYIPLAKSSRKRYDEELNWKTFANGIRNAYENYLDKLKKSE